MNTYVILGIGAALLLGAKQAVAATGLDVEPAVPAGDTLIPASAFPTYTLPPLDPIPQAALPSVGYAPAPVSPLPALPVAAAAVAPSVFGTGTWGSVAPTGGALVPVSTVRHAAPATMPQSSGFMLSDQATIKLGLNGVKQVMKWFMTPVDAPTTALSPDVASAWSNYRFGEYGDYTSWASQQSPITDLPDIDVVSNLDALATVEGASGAIDASIGGTGMFAGEVGGLEAAGGAVETASIASDTMSLLAPALLVVGVAVVLVDIAFTIMGDQSIAMKVINTAINAAIIVCMFIPVYGWIIALVLSIVKMLIGLFNKDEKAEHAAREGRELSWYLEQGAKPFMSGLSEARSPRELFRYMVAWGSGYCGGEHEVTISSALTDPEGGRIGIGHNNARGVESPNGCYWNVGGRYRGFTDVSQLTQDQITEAMVLYGATDLTVTIQAGISESMKAPLNTIMDETVTRRLMVWREAMVEYGLSLDDLDMIAAEQRKQPRLYAIAKFYGHEDWRDLVQWHLQDYWTRYIVTNREGSLWGFAAALGYADWTALRDAIMESYGRWYDIIQVTERRVLGMERWLGRVVDPTPYTFGTLELPETIVARAALDLERRLRLAGDEVMQRIAPTVAPYGGYGMPAIWVPATQSYRDPTHQEYQEFLGGQYVPSSTWTTAPIVAPYGGYGMPAIWVPTTQSYRDPTWEEYQLHLQSQYVPPPEWGGM